GPSARRRGRVAAAVAPPAEVAASAPQQRLRTQGQRPSAGRVTRCRPPLSANQRKLALERVLAPSVLRSRQRIVPAEARVEARVPWRGARRPARTVDTPERKVVQRISPELLGDLLDRAAVGDHLLAGGHVDPVVTRMLDRRRRDPYVNLGRTRLAQHLDDPG